MNTQKIEDSLEAELTSEIARLQGELKRSKARVTELEGWASNDDPSVIQMAREKMAVGLPKDMALDVARKQRAHDLRLQEQENQNAA